MAVPADLMRLIAERSGRVTLVIGAGTSVDPPTSLPLSDELAQESYRRLLADGVLEEGECTDDLTDLSVLADCVFAKTASQRPLVDRFTRERFENAAANEGHLIAAALLLENSLGAVMTLNFDLAIFHALAELGAGDAASIVDGPEDADRLGAKNVVFLHRTARADPEEWVLRSASITQGWRDGFERIAASRVMAVAAIVFIGLGSPATVLVETATTIKDRATGIALYLVSRRPRGSSPYAAALAIDTAHYVQSDWLGIMQALARRLLDEHSTLLAAICEQLVATNGWQAIDHTTTRADIRSLGLVQLGRLRGAWLSGERRYMPIGDGIVEAMFGDLVLALALIRNTTASTVRLHESGVVELERPDRSRATVLFVSGMGVVRWSTVLDTLEARRRSLMFGPFTPRVAVVASTTGGMEVSTLPLDLISNEGDLVDPGPLSRYVHVDALHANPQACDSLWN